MTFGIGVIRACFQVFGNSRFLIKELMMLLKGPAISSDTGFRNFAGIRSGPVDVSCLSDCSSFSTSWGKVALIEKVSGAGLDVSDCSRELM